MMARKKKIHHRHNRLSFGGKLAFVLLTILSAVILIPIVFTFLYSFFPQSEITAYLKGAAATTRRSGLTCCIHPRCSRSGSTTRFSLKSRRI